MAIPSRVLGSGNASLATTSICGDGATGLLATGSTAATALQLSAVWNTMATASAGGVKLPPTEAGAMVGVRNDSGSTVTVYPAPGSTINAAAASITVADGKTILFFAPSATTWAAITTA